MGKSKYSTGEISYRDEYRENDCVYSIDKFRIRIPLKWGGLRYRDKTGKEKVLTDDRVISGVSDILTRGGFKSFVEASKGRYLACWSSCFEFPCYLFLHRFHPFHSAEDYYSVILEFNPNKVHDLQPVHDLIECFKNALGDFFLWDELRCDYAFDVPYSIDDIRILSRKASSSYLGTYYFGSRGGSGYLRVYDKRKEMLYHYETDIGCDITRIEYESHLSQPFVFDIPYRIGNLYGHEVLRYVPMDAWPAALRTFNPKTAKKIKENCLIKIPFDPDIFKVLHSRLCDELGLDSLSIRETVRQQNKDREEELQNMAYDLDLISSEINRWAKNPDML